MRKCSLKITKSVSHSPNIGQINDWWGRMNASAVPAENTREKYECLLEQKPLVAHFLVLSYCY